MELNREFLTYVCICMVFVEDKNREDGIRPIDIGEYYRFPSGEIVAVLSKENAIKYEHLIKERIFIRKKEFEKEKNNQHTSLD